MDSFTITNNNVAEIAQIEAGQSVTEEWTVGPIVHQVADSEGLLNERTPGTYGWMNCVIA